MSSENTRYDIFLSYARKDNAPIPEGAAVGWVTALRDHILEDHRRFSTEPLRIFFDKDEIKDIDDWRHRILGALTRSRILLVCLSPAYIASAPCKWEWDAYVQRQAQRLAGSDTVATVYFALVPGMDDCETARWIEGLHRGNYTDMRPWFPRGAAALQEEEVRNRMAQLGSSLWERIQRSRRAQDVPGNLRRQTPFFVGRRTELRRLHESLSNGRVGVATAVHGLGGQGKTEVAVAYAHSWADWYQAGLWAVGAEGKSELLPLIGELAYDPQLRYTPTEAERANPVLLGRAVLAQLKQRTDEVRKSDEHSGAAALILLDNVSEPSLLSAAQLAELPAGDWLRIVATTRLGQDRLPGAAATLALLPIDSLNEEDALALLREHQPHRDIDGNIVTEPQHGSPRFATAEDDNAAREIVRALGGFTLAVEQVGVYLGLHPEIAPTDYLAGLRQIGLPAVDAIPGDATAADQMLHQQKRLAPILASTLSRLNGPAQTALQFAALLPPDTVPWPWLQALTIARHPEFTAHGPHEADPWQDARRRLTGLRLVTPGDEPEIARVHRLVAAHIEGIAPGHSLRLELAAHVEARAWHLYESQSAPAPWELEALISALPHLLAVSGTTTKSLPDYRGTANATVRISEKVVIYRGLPSAKSLLEPAQSYLERLAASDPDNEQWLRDLSISQNRLGNFAVAQGDLSGALRRFTEGLTVAARLAASDPDNTQWQRDLSVSHNKLGNLAVVQGDLTAALQRFTDCLTIVERLTASDPDNAVWQRDLSVSHERLGDLAVVQGDLLRARQHFDQYRTIVERLAVFDPCNTEWQRALSISHNNLGDLAMAQGDLLRARQHLDQYHATVERLATSDPGNAEWQRDLYFSHSRLGDLAVAQGDLSGAVRWFSDSLSITERLVSTDPSNAEWQRDLAELYWHTAEVIEKLGGDGAQQHWRKALDTLEGMKVRGMFITSEDEAVIERLQAKLSR